MEQGKSNVGTVVLAIIITAVVVGGGIYMWQKNLASQPITKEVTKPVVTVPVASATILNIAGLSFVLPKGWVLDKVVTEQNKISTWEVAKIKVPDPKYNVILPVNVILSDHKIDQTDELLKETSSGAKIHFNACAPAIACYYLVYGGKIYSIDFEEVESDQPVPENLDGPWFPDTTITRNDTLNFLATVK